MCDFGFDDSSPSFDGSGFGGDYGSDSYLSSNAAWYAQQAALAQQASQDAQSAAASFVPSSPAASPFDAGTSPVANLVGPAQFQGSFDPNIIGSGGNAVGAPGTGSSVADVANAAVSSGTSNGLDFSSLFSGGSAGGGPGRPRNVRARKLDGGLPAGAAQQHRINGQQRQQGEDPWGQTQAWDVPQRAAQAAGARYAHPPEAVDWLECPEATNWL